MTMTSADDISPAAVAASSNTVSCRGLRPVGVHGSGRVFHGEPEDLEAVIGSARLEQDLLKPWGRDSAALEVNERIGLRCAGSDPKGRYG
ncbi:hypothetical protein [Jiangella rhizosphaerae]|uniref:hypothetical protein n=1 Tax=Jiangella rhizosphaerae TaxID=2293569 RepID=UPI0011C3FC19|nr:hypothetical protein [Jiangella rhizosphaerae]